MSMSSSAMATADDDWVDVAEEFCGPEEWVVLAGDEGSMSAVFFFGRAAAIIGAGVAPPIPTFAPADAAATARRCGRVLLPSGVTGDDAVAPAPPISIAGPGDAVAASRGRVLLSGPWSRYYVLDPSSGERHALPPPRRSSPHDAAIASDARGGCWVVCAFRGCFEIYASSTGKWREMPSAAAAGVVPGSAASFAGCVFWKLAASPGVLALDVAMGTTREIEPPPRCSDPAALWQLGVAAGHLCAAVRAGGGVELHGLGPGPTWKLLHGICGLAVDGVDLRPLRFESDNCEVLLRMGERVVALDIVEGTAREARLDGAVLPEEDEKIVPWCRAASTLLL
ncbi:hypothetical protein SEVIR_2G275900v4 [Setaria viridis]|uniref:F-box associated domain-containing protein n=1 Tax=Setaria viridis TaxID=4556 RepID=A0A4U6VXT2_SETVI|nr:hypothetical protein SEVIR_2G275900v2 [Setaria viridis]